MRRTEQTQSFRRALLRSIVVIGPLFLPMAVADEAIQPEAIELGRAVDFDKDIAPVFRANCVACHNRSKHEGDFIIEDVAAIMKGGGSGEVVIPGKPDDSYLYNVAARIEESYMPPLPNTVQAKALTAREVGLLRQWISEGAKPSAGGSTTKLAWQSIHNELNAIYAVDTDPSGRFFAAGRAGNVTVYDLHENGNVLRLVDPQLATSDQQKTHRDYVNAIAFSPQGDVLATAGYRNIKLWRRQSIGEATSVSETSDPTKNAASNNPEPVIVEGKLELRASDGKTVRTFEHAVSLTHAAIAPDGTRVAAVDSNGTALLWNAADGKLIASLDTDLRARQHQQRSATQLAVAEARVNVTTAQITEAEKRVTEQKDSVKKANEAVKKAEETVAKAKETQTQEKGKLTKAQENLKAKPDDANLKKAVTTAEDNLKKSDDALSSAEASLVSNRKSVKLSEQAVQRAKSVVAASQQQLKEDETKLASAKEVANEANSAAAKKTKSQFVVFVSDSSVSTLDPSGTLRLWRASDGLASDVFPNEWTDFQPQSVTVLEGRIHVTSEGSTSTRILNPFPGWQLSTVLGPHEKGDSLLADRVLALSFSPDGTTLAAGGGEASRSGELTLWDVDHGQLVHRFEDAHSDTVYGLDFSRDGRFLASAAADKFVKVFELATKQFVRSYEGHTHHVMDVSWKGDGTRLASAGADNAIKVWNADTGEQTRTITTYKKQVTALEFVGMEDEFISSSGDRRVFRHRAGNGGTVREFQGCPDYVYCAATTDDGSLVAAGCEDGVLRIWDGKTGKEVYSFAP